METCPERQVTVRGQSSTHSVTIVECSAVGLKTTTAIKLGKSHQGAAWTHKDEDATAYSSVIFTADDINVIKDFPGTDYDVDSDVDFYVQENDSYHPSNIKG